MIAAIVTVALTVCFTTLALLSREARETVLALTLVGVVGLLVLGVALLFTLGLPTAFIYFGWNHALAPWMGWRPMPIGVAAVLGVLLGAIPSVNVTSKVVEKVKP